MLLSASPYRNMASLKYLFCAAVGVVRDLDFARPGFYSNGQGSAVFSHMLGRCASSGTIGAHCEPIVAVPHDRFKP